ncbi:fumarylacetoacetate hydrolase family protein [Pontibacterium sp.]|uniref:fumarylacetoacetate hydrolase family protein n=1 Tax=Pontibacterium sp. TaxID=2036026 RepID=UPI003563BD79
MRHSRILKAGIACNQTEDHGTDLIASQDQQWLPAINGTVLGIALNHSDLRDQMDSAFNEKPHVNPPKTPVLHIKTDNTHIGNGAAIPAPADGETIYAGPSLGVVIGQQATRVSAADALDYVKGYTVVNEVSLAENSFYRPAVKAKCRDGFCPIGPWVVDAADVKAPESLQISTYINGEMQHCTTTAKLHYGIAEIVEYVSSFITLQPGDLLIAGTPPRTDKLALKAGDTVAIEIEQIGRLENPVVAEQEIAS